MTFLSIFISAHSEDEKAARDYLLTGEPDFVINIIDSTNLERNLYLAAQLIKILERALKAFKSRQIELLRK